MDHICQRTISFLHLAHGLNTFFVLAPNLTIYEKLIADFSPNTAKYVFGGLDVQPVIITGDNYEDLHLGASDVSGVLCINIFNISKINSEVRGGTLPKIKRMREVLDDSYFDFLKARPDLVLLMDESHRYRAQAGMRALNDLNPLLELEVTATPFTEAGNKGTTPFKNVLMHYDLAAALEDGFVKEPAVVTQRGFDKAFYSDDETEQIKLKDGVRLHEATRAELLTYARERGVPVIKPLMLVIARDTIPPAQLRYTLFGGFARCLYPLQKFDSIPEQRFARLLERHAQKWFKPALKQFGLTYRNGASQHEYKPDFVAECDDILLMIETKDASELADPIVQTKARTATRWCQLASDHNRRHGAKPWRYLLIPDTAISEDKHLTNFYQYEVAP